MTEAEWLACEDASILFGWMGGRASARKIRLALCACLRQPEFWALLPSRASRRAVDASEAFADGAVGLLELGTAREKANAVARRGLRGMTPDTPAASLASYVCLQDRNLLSFLHVPDGYLKQLRPQADLLRDLFGNPFRPVTFLPEWRTSTVLALAQQMHESRDFSAMPILADALQDDGCTDEAILTHCRGPGPHVRGCRVVDACLGKS